MAINHNSYKPKVTPNNIIIVGAAAETCHYCDRVKSAVQVQDAIKHEGAGYDMRGYYFCSAICYGDEKISKAN